MRRVLLLFLSVGLALGFLEAQEAAAQAALSKVNRGFFIENKGQWHPDVLFLYRGPGLDAWVTRYGLNLTFIKVEKPTLPLSPDLPPHERERMEREHTTLLGHRVLVELEGANLYPTSEGLDKKPGYYNYFIGNDPSKHASFVGLYGEVRVKEVYPGISVRYYLEGGRLRYDYLVAPGADPSQIRFRIRGADEVEVKGEKLVFATRFGSVELCELRAWQGGQRVLVQFVAEGGSYRIAVGPYDRSQLLVIDPLIYSTYIGGNEFDIGYGIAVDGGGHAYVAGFTISPDYDVTPGAFQAMKRDWGEVFVTKLNTTGGGLVYSTYIGGSFWEEGFSIAVDGSGHAYVTGWTESPDFPVTAGAFQTTQVFWFEVFVTKLNPTGSGLVYSTYIGGMGHEAGYGIAVDGSGHAYVAGWTGSPDFPVTAGAFQTTYEGVSDVFVTKLNATGSGLVCSTYIGGSDWEEGRGIAVDGSGHAYVTGYTVSTNYDVTAGAFQQTIQDNGWDVFVTKLNTSGSGLEYSTYLGGSNWDFGYGIAVDGGGHAYVTGVTISTDFPVTAGAFQTTKDVGHDVFVTKLNANGSGLVYSTYLGGWGSEVGYGIAVDGSGHAYVTGETFGHDYDVMCGVAQTTYGGALEMVL